MTGAAASAATKSDVSILAVALSVANGLLYGRATVPGQMATNEVVSRVWTQTMDAKQVSNCT